MVLAGGREVHPEAENTANGGPLLPQQPPLLGAKAGLGRGRLPVRGAAPPAPAPLRFERLIAKHAGRHLGAHEGAQRARALLTAAYTLNTKRNYMTAWERFQSYCTGAGLRSLPAHYTTVAGYVGWLHTGGTVSPDSMGSYLSQVDTVHELAGYPPPTAHPIITRLRKDYLRLSAARAGGMPLYTAPLPANVIQQALALGTRNPTTEQRRVCAGLVLAFLMFNRPGAAASMRAADMTFTTHGLRVQQAFHKSEGRTRSRSAFLVPVHPHGYRSDAPLRFLLAFHRHYLAAGGSPLAPIFAAVGDRPGPRVTSHWLRLVLGWLGASPPVGLRWSGKLLRTGAATAANAVGVPLAVVAAYMEHSQTAVTARRYIDARFLPTAAAWDFFGRYISDWSGIPGPVRKGRSVCK